MKRTFHLMVIPRCCSSISLRANRPLQPSHHAFLRMELTPLFQVRDVCLVQTDIYKCPAGLIAEPAAHPCREVTRHCRRHCEILAACKRAHIDGELCICNHRKKRDCERCANQSKPHFARPFRCCTRALSDTFIGSYLAAHIDVGQIPTTTR
jgi:hypothetical protein